MYNLNTSNCGVKIIFFNVIIVTEGSRRMEGERKQNVQQRKL